MQRHRRTRTGRLYSKISYKMFFEKVKIKKGGRARIPGHPLKQLAPFFAFDGWPASDPQKISLEIQSQAVPADRVACTPAVYACDTLRVFPDVFRRIESGFQ